MDPYICIPCYNDDPEHPLGLYGNVECNTCEINVDAGGLKDYTCYDCDKKCKFYISNTE